MKKEEKKQVYILCPRCELNYITKKDKYCNVCKAEMGLLDPAILIPDEDEAGIEKLCPVCQVNYIGEDEEICFLCQKEREDRDTPDPVESWDYAAEVPDVDAAEDIDLVLVSDETTEDEEKEEFAEKYREPDDFDFDVNPDDFEQDEEEEEEDEADDGEDDF